MRGTGQWCDAGSEGPWPPMGNPAPRVYVGLVMMPEHQYLIRHVTEPRTFKEVPLIVFHLALKYNQEKASLKGETFSSQGLSSTLVGFAQMLFKWHWNPS